MGTVSMSSPGTHKAGCLSDQSCLSFPPGMSHLGVLLLEHSDLASS